MTGSFYSLSRIRLCSLLREKTNYMTSALILDFTSLLKRHDQARKAVQFE